MIIGEQQQPNLLNNSSTCSYLKLLHLWKWSHSFPTTQGHCFSNYSHLLNYSLLYYSLQYTNMIFFLKTWTLIFFFISLPCQLLSIFFLPFWSDNSWKNGLHLLSVVLFLSLFCDCTSYTVAYCCLLSFAGSFSFSQFFNVECPKAQCLALFSNYTHSFDHPI